MTEIATVLGGGVLIVDTDTKFEQLDGMEVVTPPSKDTQGPREWSPINELRSGRQSTICAASGPAGSIDPPVSSA